MQSTTEIKNDVEVQLRKAAGEDQYIHRVIKSRDLPIAQVYINLRILSELDVKEAEDECAGSEMIYSPSKSKHESEELYTDDPNGLKYIEKIFEPQLSNDEETKKEVKKLIIYGRPGIGKSTVCQFMSVQWQAGKLWPEKFKAVIWLRLKDIVDYAFQTELSNSAVSMKHIAELVQAKYISGLAEKKASLEDIAKYLLDNEDKVLFILDGYDEIKQILQSKPVLAKVLASIVSQSQFYVIMTSRPVEINLEPNKSVAFDKRLESIGFTTTNIKAYVHKFHPKIENELIKFLGSNTHIHDIAYIPLNLELICSLWSSDSKMFTQQKLTVLMLYNKMTKKLLKYFELKAQWRNESREEKIRRKEIIIGVLEQIGLWGIKNNRTIIPLEEVKHIIKQAEEEHNISKLAREVLNVGIVKMIKENKNIYDNKIYFIHQTFQEHFAAGAIAKCFDSENSEAVRKLLQEHKYEAYYERIWVDVVGTLHESEKLWALAKFLDTFENEPRELLGQRHGVLATKLLTSCRDPKTGASLFLKEMKNRIVSAERVVIELIKIIETITIDYLLRIQAIESLVRMQYYSDNVISCLKEVMRVDKRQEVALYAAEGILRLGEDHPQSIALFIKCVKDRQLRKYEHTQYAILALGRVGRNIPEIEKAIFEAFRAAAFNEILRLFAAESLIKIKSRYAKEAVDFVLNCYQKAELRDIAFGVLARNQSHQLVNEKLSTLGRQPTENILVKEHDYVALLSDKPEELAPTSEVVKGRVVWLSIGTVATCAIVYLGFKNNVTIIKQGVGYALLSPLCFFGWRALKIGCALGDSTKMLQEIKDTADVTYGTLSNTAKVVNKVLHTNVWYLPRVLDKIASQNSSDMLQQIASTTEDKNTILQWSKEGALNISLAIRLYSHSTKVVWLEPMKDINFIFKDSSVFITIKEWRVINERGQQLTKSEKESRDVLNILRLTYHTAALPTTAFDHYLSGTCLDVSTAQDRNNLLIESMAYRKKIITHRPMVLTELHKAAQAGDITKVQEIITEGTINIDNYDNSEGTTPLILAIKGKYWNIVKFLIEQGADVNLGGAINVAYSNAANQGVINLIVNASFLKESLLQRVLRNATDDYKLQKSAENKAEVIERLALCITGVGLSSWSKIGETTDLYHMFLGNIQHMKRERVGVVKSEGIGACETLQMRLHIYLALFVRLYSNEISDLPIVKGVTLTSHDTLCKLYEEIKVLAEAYITARVLSNLAESQWLMNKYVEKILEHMKKLEQGREYVISSGYGVGYDGHSIYVAFHKLEEHTVLMRVDNRSLSGGIDSTKHGKSPWQKDKEIKSYCVGIFNLYDTAEYTFLANSIAEMLNTQRSSSAVLPHIYGSNMPVSVVTYENMEQVVLDYIQKWAYHLTQEGGTNNCTLSSYNLGISVRQGMEFFEWLIGKEQQLAPPLTVVGKETKTPTTTTSNNAAKGAASEDVHSYTHTALMQRFKKALNVEYNQVLTGIVVEQSIVGLAGITTLQTGTEFRQHDSQSTIFRLNFANLTELEKFVGYYNGHFPGIIRDRATAEQKGKVGVVMDTKILYNNVAKALEELRAQSQQEKKEGRYAG